MYIALVFINDKNMTLFYMSVLVLINYAIRSSMLLYSLRMRGKCISHIIIPNEYYLHYFLHVCASATTIDWN